MATHSYVNWESGEARYLAHLVGVEYDLSRAIDWCNQYDKLMLSNELLQFLEPLNIAIVTTFIRAFGSGVRQNDVVHLWESLTVNQKQLYNYFKDIRDKHVSHSVNKLENNQVKIYYIEEKPELGATSIGTGADRVVGLSSDNINEIRSLCVILLEKVREEMDVEKAKLLKLAKELTVEEIKSMDVYVPKPSSSIDIKKSRK